MGLQILKSRAEQPVGGGDKPFPAGVFTFTLLEPTTERVRTRSRAELQEQAEWLVRPSAKGNVAVTGDHQTTLTVWLGGAEPLDGAEDPGNQIFFQEFTVEDGSVTIDDVAEEEQGEGYRIRIDSSLYANLAMALGAYSEEGDYIEVASNFREMLEAGAFDGQQVVAEVRHRKYKTRDGEEKTSAEIHSFSPAN